jgi:hypothetical protein
MLPDAVVALAIAALLAVSLAGTIALFHRAQRDMAMRRAGERRLEDTLLALQSGGTPEKDVAIERLASPTLPGKVWVKVSLPAGETSAVRQLSLTGLVPAGSLAEGRVP